MRSAHSAIAALAAIATLSLHTAASLAAALDLLSAIGSEGQGNPAASAAWKEVVARGPSALPEILAAVGKGTPVADNWLRLAAGTIIDQAARTSAPLPRAEIEAFLLDQSRPAQARILAFDLISQADPALAAKIEPSLVHDPVQSLRRGAVQRLIDRARETKGEAGKSLWLEALAAVRDEDQTKVIATRLEKLGHKVDLPRHFGFITEWRLIGPLDNGGRKGFDAVYPPEKEIHFEQTLDGKSGPVTWLPFTSDHDYGKVDLNKPFGMQKEAVAYAAATFHSDTERTAQLRLGTKNAWKVWLNGEYLFGRDEYHRGQQMDQYQLDVRLRKGPNVILVKCCQNEQKEEWTVEWDFQLRVCDSAGTGLRDARSSTDPAP
jgi:hypothetical protein